MVISSHVSRNVLLTSAWFALAISLFNSEYALSQEPPVETRIGIEGEYFFRDKGLQIETLPVDRRAPLVVRVAEITKDTVTEGGGMIYELKFIGSEPGDFDLRDYLQRVNGSRLDDTASLPVKIIGVLPDEHDGAVILAPALDSPWILPYRILLIFAFVIWLIPLALWIRNRLRRRPTEAVTADTAKSLSEKLKPLVSAAIENRLSPAEKSNLEFLLLTDWTDAERESVSSRFTPTQNRSWSIPLTTK